MKYTNMPSNRKEMEHFLEDLILESKDPLEIATIFEWLEELQNSNSQNAAVLPLYEGAGEIGCFDVFKVNSDGVARIGFVRGADNARKIVSGLNADCENAYFLYDADSSTIVESPTNDS